MHTSPVLVTSFIVLSSVLFHFLLFVYPFLLAISINVSLRMMGGGEGRGGRGCGNVTLILTHFLCLVSFV